MMKVHKQYGAYGKSKPALIPVHSPKVTNGSSLF